MNNKTIRNIIDMVQSVLIAIITFLIVCPMEQNKILLMFITILYFVLQMILNKKEIFEFYIKPNFIMYTIYLWIIIHIIAQYVFKIENVETTNDMACAFVISIYLYCIKKQKHLEIIEHVSIITIIAVNIITIIQLMINPDISRILSTGSESKAIFGVR